MNYIIKNILLNIKIIICEYYIVLKILPLLKDDIIIILL